MSSRDTEAWRVRRDEQQRAIDAIGDVVALFRVGGVSYVRAVERIQQVLDGEVARIVRVGKERQDPEVQT